MNINKFHDYKFKVEKPSLSSSLSEYHKIKIICKKINDEILLFSINGGGDYSLYLQDRFFHFTVDNETKRISAFDGELTFSKIELIKIECINKYSDAILALDTQDKLPSGAGGYIQFDVSKIFYDEEFKILQIGEYDESKNVYRFLNNAYAQLSEDGHLKAIFIADLLMEF